MRLHVQNTRVSEIVKLMTQANTRHHGSFVGERARCDGREGAADVHRASRCKDNNPYLVRRMLVSFSETRRLGVKSCLNVGVSRAYQGFSGRHWQTRVWVTLVYPALLPD